MTVAATERLSLCSCLCLCLSVCSEAAAATGAWGGPAESVVVDRDAVVLVIAAVQVSLHLISTAYHTQPMHLFTASYRLVRCCCRPSGGRPSTPSRRCTACSTPSSGCRDPRPPLPPQKSLGLRLALGLGCYWSSGGPWCCPWRWLRSLPWRSTTCSDTTRRPLQRRRSRTLLDAI